MKRSGSELSPNVILEYDDELRIVLKDCYRISKLVLR
jgi:superfamily I DNA and RNA helicase